MASGKFDTRFGKLHALHSDALTRYLVECRQACDGDLDLSVQQRSEAEIAEGRLHLGGDVERVGDRVGDHVLGTGHVTLLQTKQCQTWVWRPTAFVRCEKGLLGTGEVAASQPDVAQFDQRPSELPPHPRSEFFACAQSFSLGKIAWTRHPQNLGAVYSAPTTDPTDR